MKFVVSLVMLVSCSAFGSDVPFVKYYGKYEVQGCKEIDSTNNSKDFCATKEVLIAKAPACSGAPATQIFFAAEGQIINNSCNLTANVKYAQVESFILSDSLSSEGYKYKRDEDEADHHFLRRTVDNTYHVFTDFWLKTNQDQTVKARFKRRESPKDDSSKILTSFEYEMTLKPSK